MLSYIQDVVSLLFFLNSFMFYNLYS